MDKVRVMLVDDHAVVRLGLLTLLSDIPWIEVVAEAGTAAEAVASIDVLKPDVVIMDIRLPGENGIEACRQITKQWPQTRVILLTSYADDELIIRASEAKACGYVLKQVGNQALIDALNLVRQGAASLDPVATRKSIDRFRRDRRSQDDSAFKDLTDREMYTLTRIAAGASNAQIAADLTISEQTVCNDIDSILDKLELSNRFAAAIYAVRHHIQFHLPESRQLN